MKIKKLIIATICTAISSVAFAQQESSSNPNDIAAQAATQASATAQEAKEQATNKADSELNQFGFGPALYMIKYDEEVLKDSKDVTLRGKYFI